MRFLDFSPHAVREYMIRKLLFSWKIVHNIDSQYILIASGIRFIIETSLSPVLVLWHSGNGCNDRCKANKFKEEVYHVSHAAYQFPFL